MAETLNEIERRVLGVLLEKSLAQPQYYPMTLNAILAACNQKSNRDPVMHLDEDAVWNTLEVLRAPGLVTRLLPSGSSRVERFKHEVKEFFGWEKPQRAVLAELLLRGPQTIGELRGRCSRMYPFENTAAVSAVLDSLNQADPSRVAVLPRTPGRSAVRYAHRMYPPDEWAALAETPGDSVSVAQAQAVVSPPPPPAAAPSAEAEALRAEVENLQAKVAELHETLTQLQRRVETLEERGLYRSVNA
ncbi:MAG: YceH family protein [Phycisphaerae bacterium]|nr:YceH family protein [Phycisphaerae bacterium]